MARVRAAMLLLPRFWRVAITAATKSTTAAIPPLAPHLLVPVAVAAAVARLLRTNYNAVQEGIFSPRLCKAEYPAIGTTDPSGDTPKVTVRERGCPPEAVGQDRPGTGLTAVAAVTQATATRRRALPREALCAPRLIEGTITQAAVIEAEGVAVTARITKEGGEGSRRHRRSRLQ
jgi:hypothetical protein